jgi:hypothetical protein
MDNPSLLTNVDKWVGVCIALLGSVVVAPDGTRQLLSWVWSWTRHQGARVIRPLSRALPFLRRDANVQAEPLR